MEADGDGELKLRIDGPYRGVARVRWTRFPVVALVAGGIGGHTCHQHRVRGRGRGTIHGGNRSRFTCSGWCARRNHVGWFADELRRLATAAAHPDAGVALHVRIHITGRTAADDCAGEVKAEVYSGLEEICGGRPDVLGWFQQVAAARGSVHVAVNVCGPQSLKDDARRAAARVSGNNGLFFVEDEQFEF